MYKRQVMHVTSVYWSTLNTVSGSATSHTDVKNCLQTSSSSSSSSSSSRSRRGTSLHHHVHGRQHASRALQSDGWNRFVAGRATCSVDDQVGDAQQNTGKYLPGTDSRVIGLQLLTTTHRLINRSLLDMKQEPSEYG